MVKGVNKNVIEINDTGSEIFERIVFYVSPRFSNISAKRLLKETDKFTFNAAGHYKKSRNSLRQRMIRRRRRFILGVSLIIVAIAAVIIAFL